MEKLSNPQRTIEVIKKYEFCFQKKFGQNFLIDGHVLDKIIAGAGVTKDDMVLEIGPGIGTMTQYLAEAAGKVVAVEIDRNLLPILQETLADYDYLMNHFFIVDSATETTAEQINAASFLAEDLTLQKETEAPQILIYHSHSQETFCDSREGKEEDTIVGVGAYLTKLLSETYGYQVMHVTEKFDLAGGELDRSKAYDYARAWLEPVLKENPSIQVVIDLHRDGVPDDRRLVTEINGKETAQLLFYNGLSHTINSGDLSYLPNPYIQDNLAFSFQRSLLLCLWK